MDSHSTTTDSGKIDLLERDDELTALDGALEAAIGGRGSVVAVEGPPGIGKSQPRERRPRSRPRARHVHDLGARHRAGAELSVRHRAPDGGLCAARQVRRGPRGALHRARRSSRCRSSSPVARRTADNPELMYQRLHGLYWLIANLARQQPLLICVDDAQWADEASMAAERFLSLRIADLPMVLLLAARPAEVGQLAVPLAEILADPATVSIRPGPALGGGRRPPRRGAARLGRRRLRRRLPPRHRRQPVPARAARQRDPRRGHRADRRQRRARGLARARTRCGRPCCCGSSGCRVRAARWRARSRCSASTT